MKSFFYEDGKLGFLSGEIFFNLQDVAIQFDRPIYIYCLDLVCDRYKKFSQAFNHDALICYAMKANSHHSLLKTLAKEGAGADVVSGGELKKALESGFSPNKIVFSGVAKERHEIQYALENNIYQINVESPSELKRIGDLARALNCRAKVAFRLNPDVSAETHPYIQTGFRENKFGMDQSFIYELQGILKKFPHHLELVGLTLHIGSQIRDVSFIQEAIRKSVPLWEFFRQMGYPLKTFDVGGGLGIDYYHEEEDPELHRIEEYAQIVRSSLREMNGEIICEPGRILVARAGVLVAQVQYIKETPFKKFLILNTGMHHLLRPSLYEAYHRILPLHLHSSLTSIEEKNRYIYDVVGPICESTDVIGRDRSFSFLREGDYLGIMDVGAYGAVMASQYNSHELPTEVAFLNGKECW